MAILVVNAGSVTIKYKVFDDNLNTILTGFIDNIQGKYFSKVIKDKEYVWEITKEEFLDSTKLILNEIKEYDIKRIGFRLVHGGEEFNKPIMLSNETVFKLEKLNDLAPLHNPPAISIIKSFLNKLDIPSYASFDTAFHSTMPDKAYLYALPYEYYNFYKIRRYGFHGLSHQYIFNELTKLEKETNKVITCHLGGGASITAIRDGKSIETSMGFTPLEGLIMATRAGDVDDAAISYIQKITKFDDNEILKIENEKSGLLGISGYTSDMRKLLEDSANGNKRASLAIDMYVYRIQKYISSYIGLLNGVDAVVITAGVGAGSDIIREKIFNGLNYFNLFIDKTINTGKINVDYNLKINSFGSVPIWIIPTNEELQIAREIKDL